MMEYNVLYLDYSFHVAMRTFDEFPKNLRID